MVNSHKDFVDKIQDPTYENENKINHKNVNDLKNEIDRLSEEVNNLKLINSEHKKVNGKLQKKLTKLEKEYKDEKELRLMMYHSP